MSSVLDEKLVMDSDVVGEVLHRRIPPQELSESRDSLDLGVMPSSLMETEIVTNPSPESRSRDIVSKKRKLWSEKNDGMVQWGVRRQVNEDTEKKERNEEGGEEEGAGGRGEEEGGGGGGEQENQRNEEENDEEIARRTRKRKFHSYYGARFIQITTLISRNTNHHMVEDLSNKQGDGDLAIVTTPISCDTNPNMKRDEKELFHELVKRKAKLEEQLVQVSHSLQKIEEEMGQLESASQMQRSSEKKVELIGGEEKDKATLAVGGGGEHGGEKAKAAAAAAKAAKIERLKSGFRICKPQGTFLWPNMASPPQMMAPLDDLLVVPTPPSVSSSPQLPHHLLPPPSPNSPVKPLAQRRAVTVNVSTTVTGPTTETSPSSGRGSNTTTTCNISTSHSHGGFKSTTSSTTTTTLIDLNNAPQPAPTNNKSEVSSGLRGTLTSSFSASQRGQKNPISSTTATPSMVKFKREGDTGPWEEVEGQDLVGYCKKQQQSVGCCSSSPCLSTGVGMWLALGSPTSSHQINPNR